MKKTIFTIVILLSAISVQAQWTESSTEFTSPGTGYTKTQFAEYTWSGSHAILFNAYKNYSVSGGLSTLGNTRYANDVGAYRGGAGSIMFFGNGGIMDFLISPNSTGKDTDINWGTPKMRITREGLIGMGTGTPEAKLDIVHSGTMGSRFIESKAYLKISDGNNSMLFDNNEIYSNHMLLLGSAYDQDIRLRNVSATNVTDLMTIKPDGKVGIGTTNPSEKLSVNGTLRAKEIKCQASPWPDYVFASDYNLKSLASVEEFIVQNGHLPNIPAAAEVDENGIALGEMNARLLEKIEELTLYTIEQEKAITVQKDKLQSQEDLIKTLIQRIEKLEN